MFKQRTGSRVNSEIHLPAPLLGFDASSMLTTMKSIAAPILENWFPRPDGLVTRDGWTQHITAIPKMCFRLHSYVGPTGAEKLFGSTDDGIYDFTVAGAAPAVSIALTNGKTVSTGIATGAGNYLLLVNGTDTLKQYDGAAWTSVAAFAPTPTSDYSYILTYRQRLFLIVKNSLEIEYLAANAIAGAATNYPLGALFRKGGFLLAMAVWTIDGGTGPEDNICFLTNKGELAVFAGNDPATWTLRGVYPTPLPLGKIPFYIYGGDVLLITESGIIALTSLLQSVAVERIQTVSEKIRPFLVAAGQLYGANDGWQVFSDPQKPMLLVNIPNTSSSQAAQAVMESQSSAWTTYTGWNASCWGRLSSELYYGSIDGAANTFQIRKVGGFADNGANITATMLQAYSQISYPANKKVEEIRPYLESSAAFLYNAGISCDFQDAREYTQITGATAAGASIWGTSLWGTAVWNGANAITNDWQTVPDEYSTWKAFYLQTVSRQSHVTYLGSDILFCRGGHF